MDDEREYVEKIMRELLDNGIPVLGYPENRRQLLHWLKFTRYSMVERIKEMRRKIRILDDVIMKLENK